MKKKLSILLVCVLILNILVIGCKGTKTTNSGEIKDKEANKDKIVLAVGSVEDTFDPPYLRSKAHNIAATHVYDSLISLDEDGKLIPAIAESWSNVDGDTWEFVIKKGVKFHNGDDLKLSDIVFTFNRYKSIPASSSTVEGIKSVEAKGDNKVLIHTDGIRSNLVDMIPLVSIACERAVKELGDKYASNPIGTGPYIVKEYIKGDKIILERWEDYPFEKPKLKNIVFKAIPERSSRYIALETGEADLALELSSKEHERSKTTDKIKSIIKEDAGTVFTSLNCKYEPLKSKLVRQAIAHAIDKEAIKILSGGSSISHSMVPKVLPSYNDNIKKFEYNIDKAKELLKEAGYENGFDLKITIYDAGKKSTAELIQSNLGEVGINVEVEQLEFGTFIEGLDAGTLQMTIASWSMDNLHPSGGVNVYYSKMAGSYANNSYYVNPEIDKLIQQGLKEVDAAKSKEIYDKIQVIGADSAAYIPLLNPLSYYVTSSKLKGLDVKMAYPYLDLSKAYLE
ncbi:ABC transporter substrate-binding protein [Clostridiaceae bacterium M8S5]|nr:ABC transporter substrate-binding protein [Clostridiaceae bacterium M8S5]